MKKILSVFLSIIMLAGLCLTCYSANGGMTFTQGMLHKTSKNLTTAPRTIEVVLEVAANAPDNTRLGTIVGTYDGQGGDCFNIELAENAKPRVYWYQGGNTSDIKFSESNVDLRQWGKVHMTITIEEGKVTVYLNGEEARSRSDKTFPALASMQKPLAVGGDMRAYNERYLQHTTVYSVALFSDVRTVTEINSDKTNGVNTSDSNLICYYDLTASGSNALLDKSSNAYNLTATTVDTGSTTPDVHKAGMTFTAGTVYKTEKAFSSVPLTLEANIYLPKIDSPADSDRPGEIFCNYSSDSEAALYFGIWKKGKPRIYWIDGNGNGKSAIFHNVNVYQGKWIHLTLVRDPSTSKARCYIDGVLIEEVDIDVTYNAVESAYSNPFVLGGTLVSSNSLYFKGTINSIAAYSDVRTATEISSDSTATAFDKSSLIAAYDLSASPKESGTYKIIEDKSGNGYNAKYDTGVESPFIYNKTPITGYDYSFAVLGDTQITSRDDILNGTKYFDGIYDYILDNLAEKKIKAVVGLGDIMDNKKPELEWPNVKSVISRLSGKVPHILSRGNHDPRGWYKQMNYEPYAQQLDGTFGETVANAYKKITVGNIKYLIMAIDYGCTDADLAWANSVVAAHPDYNVIIATHSYMEADGSITTEDGAHPPIWNHEDGNNGDQMWDKFIKKHKNIVLVLCGHIETDTIMVRQDKGVNGNNVVSVLINSQGYEARNGCLGLVSMLYFSNGGKTVTYEYYSTVKDAYFGSQNQNKTFTLDVVGEDEEQTTPSQSTTPSGSTTPDDTTTVTDNTTSSDETTPDASTSENGGTSTVPDTSNVDTSVPETSDSNDENDKDGPSYVIFIIIAVAVIVAGGVIVFAVIKGKKK